MLRVAILDSRGFHAETIRALLESQPDIDVVATTATVEAHLALEQSPDILALQEAATHNVTREMISQIRRECPESSIIVVGVPDDSDTLIDYLAEGARGYVRTEESSEHFLNVVRVAGSGEALIDSSLFGALLDHFYSTAQMLGKVLGNGQSGLGLTARQTLVAEMIEENRSDAEIAGELGVDIEEARREVAAVLETFQITSRRRFALLYRIMNRPPADSRITTN